MPVAKNETVDNPGDGVEKSRSKTRRAGQFTGRGDVRNGPGKGPAKGAPNAGRPPDKVRELSRAGYAAAIPFLRRIAQGEHIQTTITTSDGVSKDIEIRPSAADMRGAADTLGKYGALTHIEVAGDPTAPLTVRFTDAE